MNLSRTAALFCSLAALAACQGEEPVPVEPQRFALEAARRVPQTPLLSPDTTDATWIVSSDGEAIRFGLAGEPPFMSLICRLRDRPAQLQIIRHVRARPGQQALFPVIGNGMIARVKLDAMLEDDEWRGQGALAASDPQLEVFAGSRDLEATLPGGGTLHIGGSRIPAEFVSWCRAGGAVQQAEAAEAGAED